MSISRDNSADYMKVRTIGGSEMRGKAKVYFTCHPSDFDRYFDEVCNTIFKAQNCAIYYTADMKAPIPETYRDTDLGCMNLFVIPVTYRLLTEDNRAMLEDFVFATENHIPVLPLMMESGIDEFYSQKFGKRQYLSPYSHDLSEISFDDKLKKYLSSILLDDQTIARIQAAFDAYIFLSYRKKDRHHANELMRLIHQNPKYQDIAIWYDEYLTPGENFDDVICKALEKSELFTLLVTPNLVNEANYVQQEEYPAAQKAGKRIVPAEMVPTDREKLETDFSGVPPCINAHNDEELNRSLLEAIRGLAVRQNDNDPEHNYLIGLAYLEGIDVETNIERGLRLINLAAEAEYPEAMKKLYNLYVDGKDIVVDYSLAICWAQRLYDYRLRTLGETHLDTINALSNLAYAYDESGNYEKALDIKKKVYALRCKVLGERDSATLVSLNNLAYTYREIGDYPKAIELGEKVCAIRCEMLGEKHPDTLISLNNLVLTYNALGEYKRAIALAQKVYTLRRDVYGEKHLNTLYALHNLACVYGQLGDYKKESELEDRTYVLMCEVRGKKHPDTLTFLSNLALAYCNLGKHKKALQLSEKCFTLRCEILGEKHPDTLVSLNNWALACRGVNKYKQALILHEKAYTSYVEILGEKHPVALTFLDNLATAYGDTGSHKKELKLHKKAYMIRCDVLGEKHPDTFKSLHNIAVTYGELGKYHDQLEVSKNAYDLACEIMGETHPKTLASLNQLAIAYNEIGNNVKALQLYEQVYMRRCEVQGKKHPDTLMTLNSIVLIHGDLGNSAAELELGNKAYQLNCEVLGGNHPQTRMVLLNLVAIYAQKGDFKTAVKLLVRYISRKA